jgi:hypothetical protein
MTKTLPIALRSIFLVFASESPRYLPMKSVGFTTMTVAHRHIKFMKNNRRRTLSAAEKSKLGEDAGIQEGYQGFARPRRTCTQHVSVGYAKDMTELTKEDTIETDGLQVPDISIGSSMIVETCARVASSPSTLACSCPAQGQIGFPQ